MDRVIILGSGAHAAEIERYIEDNNQNGASIEIVGYLDDNKEENHKKYGLKAPLLGNLFGYEVPADVYLILGVASINLREKLLKEYKEEKKCNFYTLVHHTCSVFSTVKLGEGNILCPQGNYGPMVVIGNFNTFNGRVNIGHDSVIGDNNVFCPNIGVSGNTKIGNNNFFSLNVATVPKVTIGNRNTIAPNMVVEKSIKDDCFFFHRFKETVLTIPKEGAI